MSILCPLIVSNYRVDSGEYRIIYRFIPVENLVEVVLVGKRNDDDVYKRLTRKLS